MGAIWKLVELASEAEGSLRFLKLLGVHKIAQRVASWRRLRMNAGLQFFADRAELARHRSWPELIRSVEELDACLVIGYDAFHAQEQLHKFKRLLLPNPESGSIQNYSRLMGDPGIGDRIREVTQTAQLQKIRTKWVKEFIGYSFLIIDRNGKNPRVHVELAVPGLKIGDRPSFTFTKSAYRTLFVQFDNVFQEIWDDSDDPDKANLEPKAINTDNPTSLAPERIAHALQQFHGLTNVMKDALYQVWLEGNGQNVEGRLWEHLQSAGLVKHEFSQKGRVMPDLLPVLEPLIQAHKKGSETREINTVTRQGLIDELILVANEHTNVKITIGSAQFHPFAQLLDSVFNSAGWATNTSLTAQETGTGRYWGGVEVRGFNKHLVEAVCAALRNAGVADAFTKLEDLQVPRDNPKWPSSQHKVYLKIGYIEHGTG